MPIINETAADPNAAAATPGTEAAKPTDAKPPSKATLQGLDAFAKSMIGSRYGGGKKPDVDKSPDPEPGDEPAADAGKGAKDDKGKPKSDTDADDDKGKPDKSGKGDKGKPAVGRDKTGKFIPRGEPAPVGSLEPLTPDKITEATAKGFRQALKEADEEKLAQSTAGKKDPLAALPRTERRKCEILKEMEKMWPDEYKDLQAKYLEAQAKLQEYEAQWKKENPGKEFNREDPEHDDFFRKQDVEWDEDDYDEAKTTVLASRAAEEKAKPLQEQLATLNNEKRAQQSRHLIASEQNVAARLLWDTYGEEFADIVDANGNVNDAKLKELRESNPEAYELRLRAAENLDAEVDTLYQLYHGMVKNDMENPIHRSVNMFAKEMERQMSIKPREETMDREGRFFVPAGVYAKMSEADRRTRWTFDVRSLALLRARDLARIATRQIESLEAGHRRWAKARGLEVDKPEPSKPDSPSLGGGGEAQDSRMGVEATRPGGAGGSGGSTFMGVPFESK